jgi:hypothetical protein
LCLIGVRIDAAFLAKAMPMALALLGVYNSTSAMRNNKRAIRLLRAG